MRKIFLAAIMFIFILSVPCQAARLLVMPTDEQIERLCVPVRLSLDGEIHYFYYKHVKQIDDRGMSIVYGKRLSKVDYYAKDKILNYPEASKRFKEIKSAND